MRCFVLVLAAARASSSRKAVIGFDIGTESVRAGLFDASTGELLATKSHPHETRFPAAGHAEQSPSEWWTGLGETCREVVNECADAEVVALCLAATSCTVVACTSDGTPLRDCLLWMDQRSAAESDEILRLGDGDDALNVNAQGKGPISAEWMLPKALWLKKHEPETYDSADIICECQDWLNYRCTGTWVAGGCNVATRWHCDGKAACEAQVNNRFGGRPSELLRRTGLEALETKWPQACVAMGQRAGTLTAAAAAHLGLEAGTPVAQGGADAFVGLVGLGTATRGGVGVITGSSSLHLAVAPAGPAGAPKGAPGVWGPYRGAPLADLAMREGGQATTGAALQWSRRVFGGQDTASFEALDAEAAALPVGAEGCCALETFQGARTPETDPKARGALYGLTLKHGRGHIWRALLEATALGTRASVDALTRGDAKEDLALSGGATRSALWLQMHADACGRAVVIGESAEAPLLGCAVLASALAGVHLSISAAVEAMVRPARRIEPDAKAAKAFDSLYDRIYRHGFSALKPLSHRAASEATETSEDKRGIVSASLLAADAGHLGDAADAVLHAGADWLHVDVFDGSAASNGALSSMGPQTVQALKRRLPAAYLDVHVGCRAPQAVVATLLEDGCAGGLTFQFESCASVDAAAALATEIRKGGCDVGICLAPDTPVSAITPLLDAGLVDMVDVLAVAPGRGGQSFDPVALPKLRALRARYPDLRLQVDGGMDASTASDAVEAGADVLVAGSYIFQAGDASEAVAALRDAFPPEAPPRGRRWPWQG